MTTPGTSPGPGGGTGSVPLLELDDLGDVGLHHGAGDYLRKFIFTDASGPHLRYVEWRVPTSYRVGVPLPIVFVLHGGGGWGCLMRIRTGMDVLSNEQSFIAAYPAGTSTVGALAFKCFWNSGQTPADPDFGLHDDVAYLEFCIDEIAKYFNVDLNRVYCCGHSNGGQMTSFVGGSSHRFAAVSPVAGHYAPYEQPTLPDHPVNILQFAGLLDPIHPYYGGPLGVTNPVFEPFTFEPVGEVIGAWLQYIGGGYKLRTETSGNAQGNYYRVGNAGPEVGCWTVNDNAHAWPGGVLVTEDGDVPPVSEAVPASRKMLEFFSRHTLDVP